MEKKLTAAPSLPPSRSVPEPLQESTADMNEKFGRRRKKFGSFLNPTNGENVTKNK
jgi:hypothetical protein